LDFHKASLSESQATVELTALFGGIEIFVPKEWKVGLDSSAIFGSVEDKRREAVSEDTKTTLHIKATAMFGGIEIKN